MKIVCVVKPFEPYCNGYVYDDNNREVGSFYSKMDNFPELIAKNIDKYNAESVDFIGAKVFVEKIRNKTENKFVTKYSNKNKVIFKINGEV